MLYDVTAQLGGTWGGWYVFAVLLCVLQVLHLYWGFLIIRMIVKLFAAGEVEGDVRESDEEDEEEEKKD